MANKKRTPAAKDHARNHSSIQENAVNLTPDGEEIVVPLIEEGLTVDKRWMEAGEVVIRKQVETTSEVLPVEIEYEEVRIDRVPVNRVLAYGEQTASRQEGDTLIVPVVEEEVVVSKRLVLREEVHITKLRHARTEEVTEKVRRENIVIDQQGNLEASQDTR